MSDTEGIINLINTIRGEKGLQPLLVPMDADELKNTGFSFSDFTYEFPEDADNEAKEDMLHGLIEDLMNDDSLGSALNTFATHVDVATSVDGDHQLAEVRVYFKHLALEPVGPVINGDLVIEGTCITANCAPALCTVAFAADDAEEYNEVARVKPTQMMYTAAEGDETPASFAIPFSIDSELTGSVRIEVFVAESSKVSFVPPEDDTPELEVAATDLMSAVKVTVRTSTGDDTGEKTDSAAVAVTEADVQAAEAALVVAELAVGETAEEVPDGFELCDVVTDGTDTLSDFVLFARYGPKDDGGVEDVEWTTSADAVPEGFVLVDGRKEAKTDGPYLTAKTGPAGAFAKMHVVRFSAGSQAILDERLGAMAGTTTFKAAPAPAAHDGEAEEGGSVAETPIVGLVMLVQPAPPVAASGGDVEAGINDEGAASTAGPEGEEVPETAVDGDDMSRITGADGKEEVFNFDANGSGSVDTGPEGSGSGSFMKEPDNAMEVNELQQMLTQLEGELEAARKRNYDIQRKTSGLMAKQSQQTSAAMGSRGGAMPSSASQQDDEEESAAAMENNAEKEKHFNDTLKLIGQAKVRLHKQQTEFDQLVVDLQARLDDKEFRAMEIAETFKEFKREILARAEHSRTNKPLSKRVIKEFEESERLKDEELERVRLRNISLRTGLRKVERALKAKEQLAEGLHMIDFEQLKIENQTLNEKIEERNEELNKLKRKKTSTVQVLTHIREKLRFVQKEIEGVRGVMASVDGDINTQRAVLATLKKDRDFYKSENIELRRLQGFATSDLLLDDFEDRKSALESAKASIRELKDRHAMLTTQITSNERMATQNNKSGKTLSLPKI